jgi:hypothetical protein
LETGQFQLAKHLQVAQITWKQIKGEWKVARAELIRAIIFNPPTPLLSPLFLTFSRFVWRRKEKMSDIAESEERFAGAVHYGSFPFLPSEQFYPL